MALDNERKLSINAGEKVCDCRKYTRHICSCPIDPILITGIRYSQDLMRAYAESHVFKFADKPGVWFFCQIQMCMKGANMCQGITVRLESLYSSYYLHVAAA